VQVNINYSELEEQFAAKCSVPVAKLSTPAVPAEPSNTLATVLDLDRARNVGVLMRSLKMDAEAIEAAVHAALYNHNSQQRKLEEFEIDGIVAAFPTPDEAKKLRDLRCCLSLFCARFWRIVIQLLL
jgi:hypothetical protein